MADTTNRPRPEELSTQPDERTADGQTGTDSPAAAPADGTPPTDGQTPAGTDTRAAAAATPQGEAEVSTEDWYRDGGDPDFAELEAARKAAEDEAAGPEGAEGDSGGQAATDASRPATQQTEPARAADGQPAAGQGEAGGDKAVPMIPKPRFDGVARERDQAVQTAAYWRGVAEARAGGTATPKPQDGQPQTEPTAEDRVKSINDKIDAIWEQADAGQLSLKEARSQERVLEAEIAKIERDALVAEVTKPRTTQAAPLGDDIIVDERTARLERDHPYCAEIKDEADWRFLQDKATQQLQAEGHKIPEGRLSPREQLALRTRIAELTDVYGPVMTGKTLNRAETGPGQQPAATPGQGQPATTTTQPGPSGLTRTAKERLDAITRAEGHPPDVTGMGAGGNVLEVSEQEIAGLSDDEILALPAATRRRFLPSADSP